MRLQEKRFLALEARLPPVDEQRLIVARIEKLVAQINDALRLSAEVSNELELLWRSTVDAAFRGRLLKTVSGSCAGSALKAAAVTISDGQDRSHNNAHPARPSIEDDGPFELPIGWVWTTLGSIVTHLVDCVNDTPDFANEDTGFLGLKSTNVRPYHLDLSRRWHVSEGDFLRWNRREPPRAGDILLTREAPVGFACIVPTGIKACLTQRLMLLRPHTAVIDPL